MSVNQRLDEWKKVISIRNPELKLLKYTKGVPFYVFSSPTIYKKGLWKEYE